MKNRYAARFFKGIDKMMFSPGIDDSTLSLKKNVWLGGLGGTIAISGMTLLGYFMDLPIIVNYGFALLFLNIPALIVLPFLKKNIDLIFFCIQFILIWVTFYFMIKMGGLLTSAGLLFTGISIMFMSTSYQNNRLTIILFATYITTLIATAMLQPELSPLPQMTPAKNLLFFTVNFSWQAGYTLLLILNNISQKKKLAEAKQAEAKRLKELDDVKTKLFTNITHEFRTPLTIILGMARLIREKPEEWIEAGTEKIRNNGKDLLNLVNQMLDLAKLETGAMPLHIYQQDIILQLRYLTDSFSSLAISRNIQLQFKPGSDHFMMDYDADKLMHIVSNLLSNALKYNKEGSIVEIFAGPADKSEMKFMITVADNGPGISQEHLPHIFDRFYRIEVDSGQYENGSGLGLALTRELVNLMNGSIYVKSSPEEGTIFTIVIPVSNEAPIKEMMGLSESKERSVARNHHIVKSQNIAPEPLPEESERHILLIVEDSPDLVDYLAAVLNEDYLLEFASNGKEGLQKAFEFIPDIILSDVMMPEMDGIAMLEKIKTDERTSHIPVIMLTAKADIASKLQGFERGADAYLAKPFNEEELKIRLKKLIELRKVLRQRYASMEVLPKSDDQAIKTEDAFMSKIRSIMEAHLDNEQFGITELCREAGMSRAQLYRKFKTLTDKTVNEYLIQFRLFKANELLSNTDLNVSEVAWEVGFKNLSHFSRVYSETFGHSPGSNRK
jgi:signal transduction histidine kinase/DNA-binding response OmpR family regulator